MRALELGKRNFREMYRNRIAMGFLLGFPIAFMVLMAFAFGGSEDMANTVGVVDEDNTATSRAFVERVLEQEPFSSVLEVTPKEYSQALSELKERRGITRELDGVLVIPEGFEREVFRYREEGTADVTLKVICDKGNFVLEQRLRSIINAAALAFFQARLPVEVITEPIEVGMEWSYLNFAAPGLIVFGLTILIPFTATLIVQDKQKGYLARLLTTPVRPVELVLGYSFPFVILAIIQLIIYHVVGLALGWQIFGSGWSQVAHMGVAFLVFLITGIFAVGVGMVVASMAKDENQADAISWMFIVPLAMLSGAWFPTDFMHHIMRAIANFFPTTHALAATRDVLNIGAGFGAIYVDLLIVVAWTVAMFTLGVFLFRRRLVT